MNKHITPNAPRPHWMRRGRFVLVLPVLLVLGANIVVFGSKHSTAGGDVDTAVSGAHEKAKGKPTSHGRRLWSEGEIQSVSKNALAGNPSASDSDLGRFVGASLNSSEGLKAFNELRAKALRTSTENKKYFDLLSNVQLVRDAADELLTSEVSQENEIRRVVAVRYLASALAWEKNPAKDEVLAAIDEVLLVVPPDDLAVDSKQSLYGDKIELFQYLLAAAPHEAERIKQSAQGTRMERFLWIAERMVVSPTTNELN
jgi:hypothetical protein